MGMVGIYTIITGFLLDGLEWECCNEVNIVLNEVEILLWVTSGENNDSNLFNR